MTHGVAISPRRTPLQTPCHVTKEEPLGATSGFVVKGMVGSVTRTVHVTYYLEQDDETGFWTASAQLRPGVAAFGEGETEAEAVADLSVALEGLIEVAEVPNE